MDPEYIDQLKEVHQAITLEYCREVDGSGRRLVAADFFIVLDLALEKLSKSRGNPENFQE